MPYCADFETTSKSNLEKDGYVRVWLWSLVCCETKEEWYGTHINDFLKLILDLEAEHIFFHNLKFDGQFIVDWLIRNDYVYGEDFTVLVDGMNNWYEVCILTDQTVKHGKVTIPLKLHIWDSLKKFPGQSVNSIAKMYGIAGKEEKPNFDTYRPEDYQPTPEEIEYCLQDSRIIAHAINEVWKSGNRKMTLSSDSFDEVKKSIGWSKWRKYMPKLTLEQDKEIRLAYKGGWTYLNPNFANRILGNIIVYDVNSLYPWVMRECPLPVGLPKYREPMFGELYIVKFTADFTLKEGYLPTVQIKNNPSYIETEYLTESKGTIELTMTCLDFELFLEHYDINYMSELKYISFTAKVGLLKDYIDKWIEEKKNSKKMDEWDVYYLSKRKLNSPYGKTGTKMERVSKHPTLEDDKLMWVADIEVSDGIYVPYATFVCAWARYKTITTAQKNYEHFAYADTDSVHLENSEGHDIEVDDYELGYWKKESSWKYGKYIRPKTYIHSNSLETIDEVKCAGMPDNVKSKVTWDNFNVGQEYEGKIMQRRVKGGCYLKETTFKIKGE